MKSTIAKFATVQIEGELEKSPFSNIPLQLTLTAKNITAQILYIAFIKKRK